MDFYEHIAENIYGDNYSKSDKQNIKRKFEPIFEGDACLKIDNKDNSVKFLDMCYSLFESNENKRQLIIYYKDKIKTDKKNEQDYELINNLYQEQLVFNKEYKNDCDKKLKEELSKEIVNTKMYQELAHKYKILYGEFNSMKHLQEENFKLKQQISSMSVDEAQCDLDEKEKEKKVESKLKTKLANEIDKQHNAYVREMTKKHKKKVANLEKQIVALKKMNIQLQTQNLEEKFSSSSDTDSDIEED